MLKIVFALQIAVAAAFGLSTSTSSSTSTSAPTEQGASGAVLGRVGCSVCSENYDYCLSEGNAPASCKKEAAFCYKNCSW